MDPATLASQLVAVLAPALPYLLGKAGKRAAEEAGTRLGAEAWEQAKRIWAKLGRHIQARPAALEAVRDVATAPDDEDLRSVLRVQVRKLLSDDRALAAELTPLVGAGGSLTNVRTRGQGHVVAGRDISHSTIIHSGVTQLGTVTADELGEIVEAHWLARLVMGLGALIAVGGLGLFFFTIGSTIIDPPRLGAMPDFGPMVYGWGAAFVGIVVYALGRLLARAMKR